MPDTIRGGLPTDALDDPNAAPVWDRLAERLSAAGVDEKAIAEATAEGITGIRRMSARYISFPGARIYTPAEVYEKAGIDRDTAEALWRAMGFPLVPEDEVAFTEADVEALHVVRQMLERTGMDKDVVVQQTRSMGQATARIAAAHQDVVAEMIPDDDLVRGAEATLLLADEALPALDHLLVYMYRRHLAVASEQRLLIPAAEEGGANLSVGFADLSGFTALSQELDVRELAALIDSFNGATADLITQAGGRLVKMIGDEVMYSTLDPGSAATLALTLIGELSGAEGLPALKVGVAGGVVIQREGDLFGGPVNLAKRLVNAARPGSVLIDETLRAALDGDARFRFTTLAKQYLKGFGHVRTYRLRAADDADSGSRKHHRRRD